MARPTIASRSVASTLRRPPLPVGRDPPFARPLSATAGQSQRASASARPAASTRPGAPDAGPVWKQAAWPLARVGMYGSAMFLALHSLWNSLDGRARDHFRAAELAAKQDEVRRTVLDTKALLRQQHEQQAGQADKSWIRRALHL